MKRGQARDPPPPEMEVFSIRDLKKHAHRSGKFKKPKEIACFSYDENHEFRQDASSISYYYPPQIPPEGIDLSTGIKTFKKLDESLDEHLESLLKSVMHREMMTGVKTAPDFLTFRGQMTNLLIAPYDNKSEFEMNATLFDGTIFIEENHQFRNERNDGRDKINPHVNEELFSFIGYKFEALAVIPDIWDNVSREEIESRDEKVVSNYAQYCTVVETGLDGMKIVVGAEVDAIWDSKLENQDEDINWVELKTTRCLDERNPHSLDSFRRKLLKYWAQSYLAGVPRIIVGFRDDNGFLRSIAEYKTRDIGPMIQRLNMGRLPHKQYWDWANCTKFLAAFLEFLKSHIKEGSMYRIRKLRGENRISVFRMGSGHGQILTQEFIDWRDTVTFEEPAKHGQDATKQPQGSVDQAQCAVDQPQGPSSQHQGPTEPSNGNDVNVSNDVRVE